MSRARRAQRDANRSADASVIQRMMQEHYGSAALSALAFRPECCLLCGAPAPWGCLWVPGPTLAPLLKTPPNKQRLACYSLCSSHKATPGVELLAEAEIVRELQAGGVPTFVVFGAARLSSIFNNPERN